MYIYQIQTQATNVNFYTIPVAFTTVLTKIGNFWDGMLRRMTNTKVTEKRSVPAYPGSESTDTSVNIFYQSTRHNIPRVLNLRHPL